MSCAVDHRHGLDPALLWLWPYATGATKKMEKRPKKKKKKKKKNVNVSVPNAEGS